MKTVKLWFCEERHRCRWQCFALSSGLSWGTPPHRTDPWRINHDRHCGGKLLTIEAIPEFLIDDQPDQGQGKHGTISDPNEKINAPLLHKMIFPVPRANPDKGQGE